MSTRRSAWRRLWDDRGARVGLVLVGVVVLMALLAGLSPWGPKERDPGLSSDLRTPPSAQHWLGTDSSGYDVFSRLVHGARLSLLTGLLAVACALLVGVPAGLAAGWWGGRVDGWLMRVTDVLLAFPSVVLAIAIATLFDRETARSTFERVLPVIVAVSVVSVPSVARQVRASVLQVRPLDYVTAAVALGCPTSRILWRHVMPACLAPILVLSTLGVGNAILTAAGLSFLGLGPEARVPEWGVMLGAARSQIASAEQWVVLPPGLAIAATVLGFNLLGDGLRRALDPRSR
ncbi:MAG: ABC transporter permease [Planctomycetia bacterium]